MNSAADSPPVEWPGPPRPEPARDGSWTLNRWLMLIGLFFAAHVILLFAFGARKQIVPVPATNVPNLKLAKNTSEWIALNDPTLFALPHQRDFASVTRVPTSATNQPSFRRQEPDGSLSLSARDLGTVFNEFMQTNPVAGLELQLKPPLKLSTPALPIAPVLAQTSTLQIEDGLAQRRLLNPIILPSWPYASVIAPSKVQALVDSAGNVVSAVLLPPEDGFIASDQYDQADQRALELARAARFAPGPQLTIGRLIFNWHTVPPPDTNAPEASP